MSIKIYINPSDQTENPYAVGGTNEAVVCQKMGEALEAALVRCGLEAKCNRTVSISKGVAESNAWGADYHICLHTNAFDGTVAGTRLFHSGKDEPAKACQAILKRLAPITPGGSDSITARPGLYEMGAVSGWTVYVESGFHDNPEEARWLIDHTAEAAEAICQGMCDHLGVAYAAPAATEPADTGKLYRVQIGAFAVKANAEAMLAKAKAAGFADAFIAAE